MWKWFLTSLTVACLSLSAFAQTHSESGDAGDLPETAQATGAGTITAITGSLGSDDVDMYAIFISAPANFVATTVGGATFDTQLWLFDANGKGVLHNDDAESTTVSQSRLDNSTGALTNLPPGVYFLAISRYNRDALGCDGGLIWLNTPFRSLRTPDGPEAGSRVASWSGITTGGVSYTISLTGALGANPVDPDDCPAPAPWDEQFYGGGDAGDLPANAQLVTLPEATPCETPLTRVRGRIGASNDVDMYVICITDPAQFRASTVGGTSLDTQLWLFRCDGTGVVHNDDNPDATSGLQSTIDNRSGCLQQGGIYLLAISLYNRDPVNDRGQPLWNPGGAGRGVRCPDDTLGANTAIAGWSGNTTSTGFYNIALQGAYFVSTQGCPTCESHNGDVNDDGCVDDADLLAVLFAFGSTGSNLGRVDVNCDETVDDADLLVVLFNFGSGC